MHIAQLISDVIYCLQGLRPQDTPSGPEEVQQGPRVSSSDYRPLSVLRSARRPQQVHQAAY